MNDNFKQQVDEEMGRIEAIIHGATGELAEVMLRYAVEISPVLTGAYRASHAYTDSKGRVVFEGPERPPGEEVILPGTRPILEPPDSTEVKASILYGTEPGEPIDLWNGRFY